jgi:hypothetical protein
MNIEAKSAETRIWIFDFIMQQRNDIKSGSTILFVNLFNGFTKQINYCLLNDSDLFNFVSCSPMIAIFYERESLRAYAGLEKCIVGSGQLTSPGNGFSKSCFVKNIVVCKRSGECQVIGGIWPASDELEVHIRSFRIAS